MVFYCSGREDKTLIFVDNRRKIIVEEYVVLIQESGFKYPGHVSLVFGSVSSILEAVIEFFQTIPISFNSIEVIRSDATNTVASGKEGIFALLERKQPPLQ